MPGKDGKDVCGWYGNRPGEIEMCHVCDATGLVRPESSEWADV